MAQQEPNKIGESGGLKLRRRMTDEGYARETERYHLHMHTCTYTNKNGWSFQASSIHVPFSALIPLSKALTSATGTPPNAKGNPTKRAYWTELGRSSKAEPTGRPVHGVLRLERILLRWLWRALCLAVALLLLLLPPCFFFTPPLSLCAIIHKECEHASKSENDQRLHDFRINLVESVIICSTW